MCSFYLNTDLLYFCANFVVEIDEKSSHKAGFNTF